jgi:hypothetical protein
VADVQDHRARLVDSLAGQMIAEAHLPGRTRWAVYHSPGDRLLVNMRDPPMVVVLSQEPFSLVRQFPLSEAGPHGLDLGQDGRRASIARVGESVVTLNTSTGSELAWGPIAGAPDGIWHNLRTSRLYVSIKEPGVIDVVNTTGMTVGEQISTETGAQTIAYDGRRQRL